MKPILMLHEVSDWMFELPLHEYTLTFDDGLFTQYIHLEKIKQIPTEKIFFISTNIVADSETLQTSAFIKCYDAHAKYESTGDVENYMNWDQIREIHDTPECTIGGHSHNHKICNQFNMFTDTNLMVETFKERNISVNSFCFPYNIHDNAYMELLKLKGFTEFYGEGRVDVYDL